jgi:hypothetical protein
MAGETSEDRITRLKTIVTLHKKKKEVLASINMLRERKSVNIGKRVTNTHWFPLKTYKKECQMNLPISLFFLNF